MGGGIIQPSFTSGELSPDAYGRVDYARYYTGAKTVRNFIVRQYGGLTNRPGTVLVDEAHDSSKRVRLIPFEFSTTQSYVLEFGHLTMRIIKDGGVVVWPSGVNQGQPVVVTTPYSSSALRGATDIDLIKYVQSADIMTLCHTLYPPQQLSRTDHYLWSMAAFANANGPFDDINVDETITVKASAVSGSVTLTSNVALFESGHVGRYIYLEQNPDYTTARWEVETGYSAGAIIRAGVNYYETPAGGTSGTVRPTVIEGSESDGVVTWKYIHSGFGIAKITAVNSSTSATATVVSRLPEGLVQTSAGSVKTVTGASTNYLGNIRATVSGHGYSDGAKLNLIFNYVWYGQTGTDENNDPIYGYVDKSVSVVTTIYPVDANTIDLYYHMPSGFSSLSSATVQQVAINGTPSYKWAFEDWGSIPYYPGTTSYYQQRQCFAGSKSKPQTMWMSKTAGFLDFGKSNPILDDDALSFTLNSRKATEIRHIVELSELILLTSDGPFVVRGNSDGVVVPGSVNTKKQGTSGVSHIPPIVIDNYALYVQQKGSVVKAIGYVYADDVFKSNNISKLSNHLFKGRTVVDWAYQENPYQCVWIVLDNGELLGLTFMPEEEVIGWFRCDTDGEYESVCCISEGNQDVVYFAVKRTINGTTKRFVERMANRIITDMRDAFFVDCGLTYDGRNTTDTAITVSDGINWTINETLTLTASASLFTSNDVGNSIDFRDSAGNAYRFRIVSYASGTVVYATANKTIPSAYRNVARADWAMAKDEFYVPHLQGKTVSILADGAEHVQRTAALSTGKVSLEYPAAVVHIGLPFISDLETLEIASSQDNIRDKNKIIGHVSMILEESVGVMVGPDADNLVLQKQREFENYDENTTPINGITDIRITASWSKGGRVFVRQDKPLPLSILAVIPEVALGGS